MNFEKIYEIRKNKTLLIELPERFRTKKRIKVIIKDVDEARQEKIKLLQKVSTDPFFLSDVSEIISDFEHSDREIP